MSRALVLEYFNEIDRLKQVSGTTTEGVVSEAFKDLLKGWSRQKNLVFAAQYEFLSAQKTRVRPDGTILHALRVPFGYWEAKDEADDLDSEIDKKLRCGYPQDNILFEDSREAVLIQNRQPVMRCRMSDGDELLRLLGLFFSYERTEIAEFRKAVEQFKSDLPTVLGALRDGIDGAYGSNATFRDAAGRFLDHARDTINPAVTDADVREMLIQHILTEEIFSQVFDDPDFHQKNNIARELYRLETQFFTGTLKRQTLTALRPYYATIRSNAAIITQHSEKQAFLKVIYENFYKVYDAKKADRLGVVYTPNEIVKFMVDGADWLTQKHFGKALIDEGVEILDPATGTGTFICELLEHFRGQPGKLAKKYRDELHANEVAILPYYVANLNIEATYAAITGQYVEFPNLCFVDTLDNIGGLGIKRGHQHDLFAGLSDENIERVKRQNRRKISVIIGNPPYNANQQNENDNNKNRAYPHIDAAIKATYIAQSTAQKTKQYDMYKRFIRWASDRLGDEGVVAFITNRAFVDSRQDDGFRRAVVNEFSEVYVVDLGGDWKRKDDAGGGNVFGIGTGVAIAFFVRRSHKGSGKIFYAGRPRAEDAEDKLNFLASHNAASIDFSRVEPDKNANWSDVPDGDWEQFLPVANQETKAATWASRERAIFKSYSLGVSTNRDEWLYDFDRATLNRKVSLLAERYDKVSPNAAEYPSDIKWSESLKRRKAAGQKELYEAGRLRLASYRPFTAKWHYQSALFVDRPGWSSEAFPQDEKNQAICFNDKGARSDICILAVDGPADLHFGAAIDGYQQVARYRFTKDGVRIDNITDWGLRQFIRAYGVNGALDPARLDADEGEPVGGAEGKAPSPRRGKRVEERQASAQQGRCLPLCLWRAA
ncbi:type ISP restriction/modification enzyme [Devosia sp. Root635]|uniref:type ISP restriction/modification enzyme n=1 Tax=Devosia sp. Root635 TaxID=1736575 RepID=UPI0009E9D726|nr:type ISP restriction/modification enzyme [Devosia sp. Root635]